MGLSPFGCGSWWSTSSPLRFGRMTSRTRRRAYRSASSGALAVRRTVDLVSLIARGLIEGDRDIEGSLQTMRTRCPNDPALRSIIRARASSVSGRAEEKGERVAGGSTIVKVEGSLERARMYTVTSATMCARDVVTIARPRPGPAC